MNRSRQRRHLRPLRDGTSPAGAPASPSRSRSTPASAGRRWVWIGLGVVLLAAGALLFLFPRRAGPALLPVIRSSAFEPLVAAQFDRAIAEVKSQPQSGAVWGKLGMVLQAHDFNQEAVSCFAEAARLQPREPRWPYLRAYLLDQEDHAAALPHFVEAVRLSGAQAEAARLRCAQAFIVSGQLDDAEAIFRELLVRQPRQALANFGLAELARARGQLEQARTFVERARQSPDTARKAHLLLALLERQAGNLTAAQAASRRADQLPPDQTLADPWLEEVRQFQIGRKGWADRAQQLLDQNRRAEAESMIDQLLRVHPQAAEGWLLKGRLYFERQDCANAEAPLRRHLEFAPDSVNGHTQLGIVLLCLERYGDAIVSLQRATQLKPDFAEAHFNLGFALARAQRAREAIAAFRQAIRYSPNFVDPYITLADLLAQLNEKTEAIQLLQRALQIAPEDQRARALLERIR